MQIKVELEKQSCPSCALAYHALTCKEKPPKRLIKDTLNKVMKKIEEKS